MNSHPILIFIFVVYSNFRIIKAKSANEFLILTTLFLFLLQFGSFPNRIDELITYPVHIRPMDIALIMLLLVTFHKKFSKTKYAPLAYKDKLIAYYIMLATTYTIVGIIHYGYPAIAEFRSVLFFIVILSYVSVCIREQEILPLIRSVSTYLIPLILLAPLNLFLTGDFSISISNRQFGAFDYETVTVGFLAGYLYYQYIDRKYKLPVRLLPIFLVMIPYCSHRTVWAIIFATFPIILYWTRQNKYLIYAVVIGVLGALYLQIDPTFLDKRLTAYTHLEKDPTGSWRLLIWETVIREATLLGKGLGTRFVVNARKIGEIHAGAHNGYIQNLYYMGYLGMCSTIGLILYYAIKFFRQTIKLNSKKRELFVYRLAFLATFALSLYMFGYGPDLLSWFFIGFALKLSYLRNRRKHQIGKENPQNIHRYPVLQ